jgi:hypothetical protein
LSTETGQSDRKEKSRKELLESLKTGAEDMLNTPVEVRDEEELVKIEV